MLHEKLQNWFRPTEHTQTHTETQPTDAQNLRIPHHQRT